MVISAMRRPAGRVFLAAITGGLLIVMGAVSAGPATAAPAPRLASLNPGDGVPARDISFQAISVCAKVAAKAGFSYTTTVDTVLGSERSIAVAVAIAMAESSCNPDATNINTNGSEDRGLWQINNFAWPNVSNACAFQVQCNADAAWNISDHGTDWDPWSTYNNGAWESYISSANSAVSGFSFQLEDQASSTCLDADASDVGNGGKIFQWSCDASDSYEQWTVDVTTDGHNPVLRNVGAGTCLDVDGSDVGKAGKIFQWSCNGNDTYQVWWFNGSGDLNTDGNADVGLQNDGGKTCLDVDSADVGKGGTIFQWTCDGSDTYQEWN
jgi:hypothetical protein